MKKFTTFIGDFIYKLIDYLLLLIILLIVGSLIFWRVDKLFQTNIIDSAIQGTESPYGQAITNMNEFIEGFAKTDINPDEVIEDEEEPVKQEGETVTLSQPKVVLIIDFEIPEGATVDEVGAILKEHKLIEDILSFKVMLEDLGVEDDIKPGKYSVPENIKNLDLIETITIAAN
ncbi:MAG: hypothetical protein Q4P29_02040 [Tissierellia bacterium]|nr:hypothetical protein [Tissierellia bacterium]